MKLNFKKYTEISIEDIKLLSRKIIPEKINIIAIDKNNIVAFIPSSKINLIFENSSYSIFVKDAKFYILRDIKNVLINRERSEKEETYVVSREGMKEWIQSRILYFVNMSIDDRIKYFDILCEKIIKAQKKSIIDYETANIVIEALMDVAVMIRVMALYFIHMSKKGTMTEREIRHIESRFIKNIGKITSEIINVIKANTLVRKEFNYLESYKLLNNTSAMSHAVRVCIMYIDFIFYYNMNVRLGLGSKVRRIFREYKNYYEKIIEPYNHKKVIESLEDVFRGGFREITSMHLKRYAYAASIHDIGKLDNIEYFESDSLYDKDKVEAHLFKGFDILNHNGRALETVYTMAFHHEYYGHGYGPFGLLYEAKKATNANFVINHVVTFDVFEVMNCEALAYFPSKMLEIVDLYDTLIYPWFRDTSVPGVSDYKSALEHMKSEYVEKETKIDPILYEIFVNYISYVKRSNLSYLTRLKVI